MNPTTVTVERKPATSHGRAYTLNVYRTQDGTTIRKSPTDYQFAASYPGGTEFSFHSTRKAAVATGRPVIAIIEQETTMSSTARKPRKTAAQKRAELVEQAEANTKASDEQLRAEQAELDAEPAKVTVSASAPRNAITESLKRGLSIEQTAKEHGVSVAKVKAAAAIVTAATKKAEKTQADKDARDEAKAQKELDRQAELERRAQRDADIARLADEGKTSSEIAEFVGLSVARTQQLLVKLGKKAASAPRGTANAERDALICQRAKDGETIETLSESTGLSVPRLRQILSAGGATKGRTTKSPEHDQSPEAEALRAAIEAVKACGISLLTAAAWERADRA